MKAVELKNFLMPLSIERRWEVDSDEVVAYLVHWTPWGDECVVTRIFRDGSLWSGDSDWTAFLELVRLNPILASFNLGSSDSEPEHYLLVDKQHNKFYIIPADTRITDILKLIGVKRP